MTKSDARRRCSGLRIALWVVGALVVAFVLIQLIPYGRDHTRQSERRRAGRGDNGEMPPLQYSLAHPGAKLSAADKQELVAGFRQSLGSN